MSFKCVSFLKRRFHYFYFLVVISCKVHPRAIGFSRSAHVTLSFPVVTTVTVGAVLRERRSHQRKQYSSPRLSSCCNACCPEAAGSTCSEQRRARITCSGCCRNLERGVERMSTLSWSVSTRHDRLNQCTGTGVRISRGVESNPFSPGILCVGKNCFSACFVQFQTSEM